MKTLSLVIHAPRFLYMLEIWNREYLYILSVHCNMTSLKAFWYHSSCTRCRFHCYLHQGANCAVPTASCLLFFHRVRFNSRQYLITTIPVIISLWPTVMIKYLYLKRTVFYWVQFVLTVTPTVATPAIYSLCSVSSNSRSPMLGPDDTLNKGDCPVQTWNIMEFVTGLEWIQRYIGTWFCH